MFAPKKSARSRMFAALICLNFAFLMGAAAQDNADYDFETIEVSGVDFPVADSEQRL